MAKTSSNRLLIQSREQPMRRTSATTLNGLARPLTLLVLVCAVVCLAAASQQKEPAAPKSAAPIQNRSVERKPSGPADGGKTVLLPPRLPQNPPQTLPPQNPPQPPEPPAEPLLQLTFGPQQVRIGEEVKFMVRRAAERLDLVRRVSFEIDFDDQTERRTVEIATPVISHRFAQARSYNVRLYLKGGRVQAPVSNTVTVKVDPWTFTPSKTRVEVGEPVTLEIDNPSDDPNINYWFHFREGTETTDWGAVAVATYRYHSGGKFATLVDIRAIDGSGQIVVSTEPKEIVVQQLPKNALLLDVQPPSAQVENSVSFTATFNSKAEPDDKNLGYKFFFGDDTSSEWQRERTIQHPYQAAGDYQAQVAVGWRNEQSNVYTEITRSESRPIAIQRPPGTTDNPAGPGPGGTRESDVPLYIVYIFAGLVVIAMALLIASYRMRKGYLSATPEYVAQPDGGSAQTTDGRLALDFELQFSPNSNEAWYQIHEPTAGLIRFERITHD